MRKTMLILSAMLIAATQPTIVSAEGSSGRGGGDRVGQYLRDLVDQGTCTILSEREFEKKYIPDVDSVLEKFSETHWLFSWYLRQELSGLKICMVDAQLRRIRTTDLDDYTYVSLDQVHPVAIRSLDDGTVYIERSSFRALNAHSKPYFIIHEAMHSFIDMNAQRRNHKVRNIVHNIELAVKHPMKLDDFLLQMQHSEVQVPTPGPDVDAYKDKLLAALNPDLPEEARQVAAVNLIREIKSRKDTLNYGEFKDRPAFEVLQDEFKDAFGDNLMRETVGGWTKILGLRDALDQRLLKALHAGNRDEVKRLAGIGANSYLPTEFVQAYSSGNLDTMRYLMELNLENVNSTFDGWSCNPSTVFEDALRNRKKPETLLMLSSPHLESVAGIIQFRARYPECLENWEHDLGSGREHRAENTVFEAIDWGNMEILDLLLKHPRYRGSDVYDMKPDPNATHKYMFYTPLDWAVKQGRRELLPRLIASGFFVWGCGPDHCDDGQYDWFSPKFHR